jgi:hypothetical protein
VISCQFSVEENTNRALNDTAGESHVDTVSELLSLFPDFFDQSKKHPFDLSDPGIQNGELFFGKQVQVSGKKNVVLQFTGRPKRNEEKLPEFRIGGSSTTFGDVCRDRSCCAADLAGQSEQLLFRKEAGDGVQAQGQSVTFPPDQKLGEVLHEAPFRQEVYCVYLTLNTDNCKLQLRSGYVH